MELKKNDAHSEKQVFLMHAHNDTSLTHRGVKYFMQVLLNSIIIKRDF